MSTRRPSDHDYVQQLGAVLRARSAGALREFLVAQAREFGDDNQVAQVIGQSDEEIEALLHRMTLARSDLGEFHQASRAWLVQRGLEPPTPQRSRRN